MNCIALIIRFLLTALVFLISYKIGLDEAKLNPKPDVSCPKAAPTPLHSSSSTNHLLSHDIDSPAGVNLFDSSSDFIFHKNIGKTMNTRVFSSLYHTNSQVKAEFIVTSLKQWEDSRTKKVKCTQVYRTTTGSRENQPSKCVAIVSVPEGYNAPVPQLHRVGTSAGRLDQFINDFTRHENRREGEQMLPPFLQNIDDLREQFLAIVGSPHKTSTLNNDTDTPSQRKTIVVMVANTGVFNLLLNFMCSCRSSGIDTKSIIVFVGEQHHVNIIHSMGATPVYLPAMGEMPTKVAGNYGDKVFGKMMWLKVRDSGHFIFFLICFITSIFSFCYR